MRTLGAEAAGEVMGDAGAEEVDVVLELDVTLPVDGVVGVKSV